MRGNIQDLERKKKYLKDEIKKKKERIREIDEEIWKQKALYKPRPFSIFSNPLFILFLFGLGWFIGQIIKAGM